METISGKDMKKRIESLGMCYLMEADTLNYLLNREKAVEYLSDSEVLLFINYEDNTEYVNVLPIAESFDIDKLLNIIKVKCKNPSLLINVHNLSKEFEQELDARISAQFKCAKRLIDYINDEPKADIPVDVRLLTSSDFNEFVSCTKERPNYRPPLQLLFDIFVNKQQGQILGAFENDRIVGYLSYNSIAANIADVDYIYVIPDKRRCGIGKKLATAYCAWAKNNQCVAYWSNAVSEMSERTAESAGFSVIRRANKYIPIS